MTKLKELIDRIKDKALQGKAAILSKRTTLSLLRATSHDSFTPPNHKYINTLLSSGDGSRATASSFIELLMDRLQTTQNSAVALKCLIAVHHIIKHGTFILQDQLSVYPYTGGRNYLNLSNFRDKTNPISWELSSWVRFYAHHIEQLLCTSRILGFFLGASSSTQGKETHEETVAGLTNADLLREIDSLLALVEGIGKRPNPVSTNGNKLVVEIVGLVEEDGVEALREVSIRVNEFRERMGSLSFGEGVELVYAMKRLEECIERVMMMMMVLEVAHVQRLWDSVRELKEKAEIELYKEERKVYRTVTRHREIDSVRINGTVLNSVGLVQFPSSSRFL
ncbi:putative clathrin assembly protein At4g40080 [Gastrolobium bilobum]|uniref:putative clathrin assembly protein At4g40080 n=1 Tax=Gastrolobium bilobum TaxID=150636 RepID=UPI002AB0C771|nr:putative clathrin assembly protein At4g40080 [Gastrolobium bilobum]